MSGDPADPEEPQIDLQLDRPHPARVYNYLLGGKDHFAADRDSAEKRLLQPVLLDRPRTAA